MRVAEMEVSSITAKASLLVCILMEITLQNQYHQDSSRQANVQQRKATSRGF